MGTSLNFVRIPISREQPDCWNLDKRYIRPMGVWKKLRVLPGKRFQPCILSKENLISDSVPRRSFSWRGRLVMTPRPKPYL